MTDRFKPYTCTYRFNGKSWGFHIEAEGFDDASPRFRAIGMTAVADAPSDRGGRLFPCAYQYKGRPHAFRLEADSLDDARARLGAIGRTAVVEGEFVREVTLPDVAALGRLPEALLSRIRRAAS